MGRVSRTVFVLVAAALIAVPAAVAATPQQIYRDYQNNGRLDGRYSVADLKAALNSPSIQGYGQPTVLPGMRREIRRQLGNNPLQTTVPSRGRLPFTGFDLALMTFGGAGLLGLGLGLRRVGRAKS